jgi:hypothetical protein
MSFKIKDLSVSLFEEDPPTTCTTMTKPTGCVAASIYWRDGSRQRNLAVLKTELRTAMTRS